MKFKYIFNQLSSGGGREPIPISDNERILASNANFALTGGDTSGAQIFRVSFWEDRVLRGDPLAVNAIEVALNNFSIGWATNAAAGTFGTRGLIVGIDIIRTYIRSVDLDYRDTNPRNWRGVLSNQQINAFHVEVFARQGIGYWRYTGQYVGGSVCKPQCDPYSP